MAFRYINPGYVSLLADTCSGATEVMSTEYSKTGVGFSHKTNESTIPLPKVTADSEIFVRFDAYISKQYCNIYLKIPYMDYAVARFDIDSTGKLTLYAPRDNTSNILAQNINIIKNGKINSFLIRLKCGSAGESICEVTVNSEKFSGNKTAITYSSSNEKVAYLYSLSSATTIFSNVIISDTEISPKEQGIALPPVTTLTNMTAGASGIYVANEANQFLLQSVDVSTLIENYGASSAVTGIALVGNPAYKTATGLAALKSLSKAGTSTIEHGTVNLSDDTSAVIVDGWATENLTIADLQNIQFGWKAGT